MASIRDRFEALQRYQVIAPLPGETCEAFAVDDVLTLADALDAERCPETAERDGEVMRCLRRAGHADCHIAESAVSALTVRWWTTAPAARESLRNT